MSYFAARSSKKVRLAVVRSGGEGIMVAMEMTAGYWSDCLSWNWFAMEIIVERYWEDSGNSRLSYIGVNI